MHGSNCGEKKHGPLTLLSWPSTPSRGYFYAGWGGDSACHSARKWCSSGESFSGVLSHRDDGVFSGLVCGDYFDLDSWGVTWEDELSCVQMLFVPLWVTFSYTVTAFCNKNFHV